MSKHYKDYTITILIGILISVLVISLSFIMWTLEEEKREVRKYSKLKQTVINEGIDLNAKIEDESSLDTSADPEEISVITEDNKEIDWDALKAINPDIVAWIEIPEANIDYPVLYSEEGFYLDHDYEKKESKFGAIFTNVKYNSDTNAVVIHGHNMRNGSMFGSLKVLYRNRVKNATIKVYFPDGYTYDGYISTMIIADKDYDPNEFIKKDGSKSVILSTCYGFQGTDKRLIAISKEIIS